MAAASLIVRVSAQVAEFQKSFADATRTTQKFERDFANTASSVSAQQKRISDAFSSFSGDKLAREASAVAKAVEQIGGASKLTAGEQARVNATVTEAIAKYAALGQAAPKALIALEQATRKTETASKSLADAIGKIPKPAQESVSSMGALSGIFGKFTAANLAANAITAVVGSIGQFVTEGKRLPGLQSSFENLNAAVKQSSTEMLSSMQGATRGLVTDVNLMQSANKALLLGLPATAAGMGDLASTARILGRAMGQDATKSLDDLITALGRSSPLILDNLGLTVKVGEANEKYAKNLGITADQLTDAQKKMAFFEAAMEAARKKTQELGDQTLTLGERIETAWTAASNFITRSSSNINIVLGQATDSWGNFFRFLGDTAKFKSWEEMAAKLRTPPALRLPEIDSTALARVSQAYLDDLKETERAYDESKRAADAYARSIQAIREELSGKGAIKAAQDMLQAVNSLRDATGKSIPVWNLTRAAQDRVHQTMESALDVYRAAGKDAPDAIRRIAAATMDLSKLSPGFQDGLPAAFANVGRQARLVIPEVAKLYDFINDNSPVVATSLDSLVKASAAWRVQLQDVVGDAEKAQQAAANMRREWDDLARSIGQLGDMLGGEFGAILSNISTGWLEGAAAARAYAQATTDAGRAAAVAQGAMAVWNAAGAESRTAATLGSAAAGAQTGAAIGTMISPGVGTAVGLVIGGVAGAITGFVRSAGQGREAAVAFAASFDTLAAGDGFTELREKLNALGAEGERLWVNLTQGVGKNNPEGAAAAILAIDEALKTFKADPIGDAIKASGFQTRAQLEELATTAKGVYERMRDSGEFTATSVQAAFERMQEAQMTAFGDSTATDSLKARLAELDTEFNTLFKSIENEAPEEVMGDIEKMARERMKAIELERMGVESEMDKVTKGVEDNLAGLGSAAEMAARAIEEALSKIRIEPIRFPPIQIPGMPGSPTLNLDGGGSEPGPSATSAFHVSGSGSSRPGNVMLDGHKVGEYVSADSNRRYRGRTKVSAA